MFNRLTLAKVQLTLGRVSLWLWVSPSGPSALAGILVRAAELGNSGRGSPQHLEQLECEVEAVDEAGGGRSKQGVEGERRLNEREEIAAGVRGPHHFSNHCGHAGHNLLLVGDILELRSDELFWLLELRHVRAHHMQPVGTSHHLVGAREKLANQE